MLKLLTIPSLQIDQCKYCSQPVKDIVLHCIAECSSLTAERDHMWDIIIDKLNIDDGIDLFNKSDDDIIDIFLGKSWGKLRKKEYVDTFYLSICEAITPLIKGICKNICWYKLWSHYFSYINTRCTKYLCIIENIISPFVQMLY